MYRYLDKLQSEQIKVVQKISFDHTQKILGNKLSVVFYDVNTLYFEAQDEDDLRRTGFSKDGKHSHSQIVLGLLVSEGGYPLDYEIFEGNKFEGHTMLPVIEAFKEKYQMGQLIVVADAGLMSEKNIMQLLANGYSFIIGARIKNESQAIQHQILSIKLRVRISKTDLRIRPVYHFKRKRIEAHICIAFAECKVYKELERQLRNRKSDLSPKKAIEILKTIYGITIPSPQSKENKLMLLDKTKEQKALLNMFI